MTVLRVDHTALAVRDLDEAVERYCRLFEVEQVERMVITEQEVEVAFLTLGDTTVELVTPLGTRSGVARFLQKRGEALHHIGMEVDRLDLELDRLTRDGVELIDQVPRVGAHGHIAFLHPRATGGVLVELVEHDPA